MISTSANFLSSFLSVKQMKCPPALVLGTRLLPLCGSDVNEKKDRRAGNGHSLRYVLCWWPAQGVGSTKCAWDVCVWGCGCGCVHTHTPQVAWHGGGVRECCLKGESSAHALNMMIRLTEPRRAPPIPVLSFQTHPRQTSQASPTSLSPPGSIRKRTLKTQKREEPRVEGAAWSRSEALPTLLWAALVRTYHLKPHC